MSDPRTPTEKFGEAYARAIDESKQQAESKRRAARKKAEEYAPEVRE